ncbi:unnamed protein product, partial [Owenia fusiformis]
SYSCSMYRCESNDDSNDWDYGWQYGRVYTETAAYALPHPSNERCQNSYFIRTAWNTSRNTHVTCYNSTNKVVDDIQECMSIACQGKANVLDYFKDKTACRIMNCTLNYKIWEYSFSKKWTESDKVVTYTLISSQINTSKTTITSTKTLGNDTSVTMRNVKEDTTEDFTSSTDQMRTIASEKLDFKMIVFILTGTTAILLILVAVKVVYDIAQRLRRKRQMQPRNISIRSSDASSWGFPLRYSGVSTNRYSEASTSTYALIDESKMLPQLHQYFRNRRNDTFQTVQEELAEIFRANHRIDLKVDDTGEIIPLRILHPQGT